MPGQAIRSDQSIVMFSVADVRQHDHEDIAIARRAILVYLTIIPKVLGPCT